MSRTVDSDVRDIQFRARVDAAYRLAVAEMGSGVAPSEFLQRLRWAYENAWHAVYPKEAQKALRQQAMARKQQAYAARFKPSDEAMVA